MTSILPGGLPFEVPVAVLTLLRQTFAACNDRVSGTLSRIPTTHEDALDQQLIAHLTEVAPIVEPTSGWIIGIETHFLGGGHHFLNRWEIADVGVIVVLRRGSIATWSKAALLQSKRLFPRGSSYNADDDRTRFAWGFGRLHARYEPLHGQRQFEFGETSRYDSLDLHGEQAERLVSYQGEFGIPVHYLFYNPVQIPWAQAVPVTPTDARMAPNDIGCRVLRSRSVLDLRARSIRTPTFGDILAIEPPHKHAPFNAGWRLEDFVVSLLLGCREGRVLDDSIDSPVEYLFNRRNYPIAAAFAVNIELPE